VADPTVIDPVAAPAPRRRRKLDLQLVVGLVIVGVFVLAAIFGPMLVTHGPLEINQDDPFAPPGGAYLLGTDDLGRDQLSRILSGLRISLSVAAVSVLVSLIIGGIIGVLSGYYRGVVDGVLMRIVDVLFAFPVMLLALLMVAILGTSTWTVMLAVALVYIPYFARIARSSTLSAAQEPYIALVKATGASQARILFRHILPNIAAPLIVQTTFCLTWAILIEASLSFLGLGVQPPDPSIGSMISDGQNVMRQAPWIVLTPSAVLFALILALNLVGDSLRDIFDPRRKGSAR
jgi:peptide/nickel transport system permease protein